MKASVPLSITRQVSHFFPLFMSEKHPLTFFFLAKRCYSLSNAFAINFLFGLLMSWQFPSLSEGFINIWSVIFARIKGRGDFIFCSIVITDKRFKVLKNRFYLKVAWDVLERNFWKRLATLFYSSNNKDICGLIFPELYCQSLLYHLPKTHLHNQIPHKQIFKVICVTK